MHFGGEKKEVDNKGVYDFFVVGIISALHAFESIQGRDKKKDDIYTQPFLGDAEFYPKYSFLSPKDFSSKLVLLNHILWEI